MGKKNKKHAEHVTEQPADAANGKLKNKVYDKELEKLHVELVKLQEWVVAKGLKVCIVFEGRDGAGKGNAGAELYRGGSVPRGRAARRSGACPRGMLNSGVAGLLMHD